MILDKTPPVIDPPGFTFTPSAPVGTLNVALASGVPTTSITLAAPLTAALASGTHLTIVDPAGQMLAVTVSSPIPVPVGATVIPIASVTPATTFAAGSSVAPALVLSFTTHDPLSGVPPVNSNIAQAEYFLTPCTPSEDASCFHDPGPGNGTQITVPANTGTATLSVTIPAPTHGQSLYVRVRDAAGNWTAVDLTHPVATF
jgi:hypothetical protein